MEFIEKWVGFWWLHTIWDNLYEALGQQILSLAVENDDSLKRKSTHGFNFCYKLYLFWSERKRKVSTKTRSISLKVGFILRETTVGNRF